MNSETTTPQSVFALCRELDIKSIALRFTDFNGQWLRFTMPVSQFGEEAFEDGVGISLTSGEDGPLTSLDILLVPEPRTAFVDPFAGIPTLNLICRGQDPLTRDDILFDARGVAEKAASYLAGVGTIDQAAVGFEAQFHLFDGVRFRTSEQEAFFTVNGGHNDSRFGQGAATSASLAQDTLRDTYARWSATPDPDAGFRDQVIRTLQSCGVHVQAHQTYPWAAGLQSLRIAPTELTQAADAVMITKYVVKGIAKRLGRTATFMPKPHGGPYGAGLHTHLLFSRHGEPLFSGSGYAGLSDSGLHAIGGWLKHAAALVALTSPTTNSYRRLSTPQTAPNQRAYSQTAQSAMVRVPLATANLRSRPIEFCAGDGGSNPYLAFSALTLAALDGAQNKFPAGDPLEPNNSQNGDVLSAYPSPGTAGNQRQRLPFTLGEALAALEIDHEFLTRGDVMTSEMIEGWIDHKRSQEIAAVQPNPHPTEFGLYFDI